MNSKVKVIKEEICKVVSGKDEVVTTVLTTILAGGHILLEDIPGVGKTTLALSISKALGLSFNRIQFTPDIVPSDITGFTMYDKVSGQFSYKDGAVCCNFFLADEINRTSSKTQSALLEVMQEGKVTVDGETHYMPKPFVVMATQNPVGTAGTQMLPEAQLDRFMVKLSMGYPDFQAQVEILKNREKTDPMEKVEKVVIDSQLLEMKEEVNNIHVDDKIYSYITELTETTRKSPLIKLGVSPRGALALCQMAKAWAYVEDRDYVVPEDIKAVFLSTCNHRLVLSSKANLEKITTTDILQDILTKVAPPRL